MKTKNLLVAFVIIISSAITSLAQKAPEAWQQKTNLPGASRVQAFSFTIGNKAYIGGGRSSTGAIIKDMWEYDSSTDLWIKKADYPGGGCYSAVGFAIGDTGYVGLAYDGATHKDFYSYDPSNDSWKLIANFPGIARYASEAFVLNQKAYIIGGSSGGPPYLSDVYEFNPINNVWTKKTSLPGNGVIDIAAFSDNNFGYVCAGYSSSSSYLNALWQYDPIGNTWTSKSNFPGTSRSYPMNFVIGNKAYIGCGSSTVDNKDFYEYNFSQDQWTRKVDFPGTARYSGRGFSIGNKGYFVAGYAVSSGTYFNDLWEYFSDSSLVTSPISTNKLCGGGTVRVAFDANTTFNSGNVFTSQLSNASGNFVNPVNIGSLTGTISDTIIASIPTSAVSGIAYRIRVVSSDPVIIGLDNDINLSINPLPTLTITANGSLDICPGDSITLDAGNKYNSYTWNTGQTASSIGVSPLSNFTYSVDFNDGTCSNTSSITVNVKSLPMERKRINIWYFGDKAGLDFNSSPPAPLTNSAMYTLDNTAVADDNNGNLLFYTNGVTVWNKNHIAMPNGAGLLGSTSGGQTATIIPKPGNNNIYYVFTVDAFAGSNGFRYSIVDMSLEGGLGNITTKNTLLLSAATEKVTAIKKYGSDDYWIICHQWNSNSFYAYQISSSGIDNAPIISSVGTVHTGGTLGTYNAMGQMTVSPDGKKIALAVYDLGIFELFDFNNSTGVVSNPITIPNYPHAWGITFSPNSTVIYANQWLGYTSIYQFNLLAGSNTNIINSSTVIGTITSPNSSYKGGYMQIGPDGKVYIAKYESYYLGRISNPNQLGLASNYIDDGIYLGGKKCLAGLPNFIQSDFNPIPSITISGNSTICSGQSSALLASGGDTYLWSDQSVTSSVSVTPAASTTYSVTGTIATCKYGAAFTVKVNPLPTIYATANSSVCSGTSQALSAAGAVSYNWLPSNGLSNTTGTIVLANPSLSTNYSVAGTDTNGCTNTSNISISINPIPTLSVSENISICPGDSASLMAGGAEYYSWFPGTGLNEAFGANVIASPPATINYIITGTSPEGCSAEKNILLSVYPSPEMPVITTSGKLNLCAGNTVNLISSDGFNFYLWSTGESTSTISVSKSDNYEVTVTDANGCHASSNPYILNYTSTITPPAICLVGVDTAINKNIIIWDKPVSTAIDSFVIYKETNRANKYEQIGSQPYSAFSTFTDVKSNPRQQANRYKLGTVDTCGSLSLPDDFHKTVHLVMDGIGSVWNLIWSHYEGFAFDSYNIYRGTTSNNMMLLGTIASNLNSFSDLTPPAGLLFYQIEVVNSNACNPSFKTTSVYNSSLSNIVNNAVTGIASNSLDANFQIYPNPNKGTFTMELNLTGHELVNVKVLNALGQEIFSEESTVLNSGKHLTQIDLEKANKGIYFVRVQTEKEIFTRKMIVE